MIRERENSALPGLPVAIGLITLGSSPATPWSRERARKASGPSSRGPGCSCSRSSSFWASSSSTRTKPRCCSSSAATRAPSSSRDCDGRTRSIRRSGSRSAIRNFESSHLKVNDNEGNPIEIAAVVVWRVVDTAEAVFEVDDYNNYVKVQTESALRNLATSYTYDAHDDAQISLRGHTAAVAEHLKKEIQDRLNRAGVEVIEARISHLAYAQEIAQAMLQRQQAGAIIAARQRIVEGAVGMVEMALEMLSRRDIVTLDNERKAAMVSNLLVVLCGDRSTQPVINAGTIYQ